MAKKAELKLASDIAAVQKREDFTIGRRRMGASLRLVFGYGLSEFQAQRIMRKYDLQARTRRIRKAKPCAKKGNHADLPNLLNRQFTAKKPYHRMVTDVTYIPYFEGDSWHWGYLSLVQDLYDRSIIAWVFAKRQDIQLANRTLFLLSMKPLAADAMLHSDRGSIYTAEAFRMKTKAMGLTQSFSRTGNCHDNATMECFNGTLKVEAFYNPMAAKIEKPSFLQQNAVIERFITFYNEERPCSVNGNLTPVQRRSNYFAGASSN